MRNELRRIEAMLAQLAAQPRQEVIRAGSVSQTIAQTVPAVPALRPPSFTTKQPSRCLPPLADRADPVAASARSQVALKVSAQSSSGQSPALNALKMPTLPRLKASDSPQHTAKPALVVNVLKAIEGIALGWQDELHQCLRHIQNVYAEGPIVDGWLESYATGSNDGQTVHSTETNDRMNATNNDRDRSGQASDRVSSVIHTTADFDAARGCRLCGFNDDGQLWFRYCPPEQVPAVSLAIDRCERMKRLLTRKQHLETQFGKLAEALTVVYGPLTDSCAYDSAAQAVN